MRNLVTTAALAFASIVLWLHSRRRDVDPATQGISHYAVGRTHGAMTVAFLALAVSLIGAARVIESAEIVWLRVAAVSLVLVAVLPVSFNRSSPRRDLAHTIAALAFFLSVAIGAVLASAGAHRAVLTAAWFVASGVVVFLVSMTRLPVLWSVRGWLQRACFSFVVIWLLLTGACDASTGLF
ncbi:MAG TPA: DUF998 domain-containing protein [Vicinamibacterales bacterium]|nr:DUF998 domain-containing protein [Vicinamibacterales bacterium]